MGAPFRRHIRDRADRLKERNICMRIIDILQHRFRSLFLRKRVEQELEEELRYRIEREIEEYAASGMRPSDASQASRLSKAGLEQRKEECRDARGFEPYRQSPQGPRVRHPAVV
jgi:hypothetical protein